MIDRAIANCDAVIHSAGLIHIGWKKLDESMRVNRDGTRIIAEACLKHGRKLVHVGTVDTLPAGTRDQPADETTPPSQANRKVPCSYVLSKRAGVDEVLEVLKQGLDCVIVHPGFMLGPWDWKPSSGRMMLELGRGWKPIAPSGGCSVCDSRDVAAATIRAIDAKVRQRTPIYLGRTEYELLRALDRDGAADGNSTANHGRGTGPAHGSAALPATSGPPLPAKVTSIARQSR